MSFWDRLLELTAASPFTGTWMSLATAAVAFLVLVVARRLLPPDDAHHGRGLAIVLLVALSFGLLRLGLVALGAGDSIGGKLLRFLTTFCVATGVAGTLVMVVLEILPNRTGVRFPSVLRDLLRAILFVLITFGVLAQSGVNITSQITAAGILTAVVGLALQNTIANLFAGLVLNMDRELNVGDWIDVNGRRGQIVVVRWRSTILRTVDGDLSILPNTQLIANEVYNYSRPVPRHRVWLPVIFHHRHPPNEVRQMLAQAARDAPGVMREPAPDALIMGFQESAIRYEVRFWIEAIGRQRDIESEVNARIWYAARRAGMEIPFPQRVVHMTAEAPRPSDGADRLAALDHIDLFTPLAPAEREILASGMRLLTFGQGETILRQGEPGDSIYLVVQGRVGVILRQGSAEETVADLGPGTFFGEMSLLTGEPRSATCLARTDVVTYVIDQAVMREVLKRRPQVAEEMSSILATRQAALVKKGGEIGQPAATAENRRRLLSSIRSLFGLD